MPTRNASAVWEGGLKTGKGSFKGESGSISGAYSFGTRFGDTPGSNPEELLAAAEASCYSMALSGGLEKNGTPATKIETSAACTIEQGEGGFAIKSMKLDVTVNVPGIENAKFQEIATATKSGCPVSKALSSSVEVQLTARLV
jgi:lipoyl-dependent peroxiredoxin